MFVPWRGIRPATLVHQDNTNPLSYQARWIVFCFLLFNFSFLLNLLGVTIKLYRFQIYDSTVHHLCIVLYCVLTTPSQVSVHHPLSPTSPTCPPRPFPLAVTILLSMSMSLFFFAWLIPEWRDHSQYIRVENFYNKSYTSTINRQMEKLENHFQRMWQSVHANTYLPVGGQGRDTPWFLIILE